MKIKTQKKNTPLDKKNLLLFKQNLGKHIPDIVTELNSNIKSVLSDKKNKDLTLFDKVIEITNGSFSILGKEDRMVYVGTTSLIVSFALMLFDISL